jgi:pimeloyl-ACP methyl ester carboxylesterase
VPEHIHPATRQRLRLSGGTELSFITAGDASKPAVLLLQGTPNSSRMFRQVVPALAQAAHVMAPDLPGCGVSDALPAVSFAAIGEAISELLRRLAIGPSGEGTTSTSSSMRCSPGCARCRGWKPTSSTPATCCSRRIQPWLRR